MTSLTLAPPPRTIRRASALLAADGPVARMLKGAEVRPAQLAMAEAVEDALRTRGMRLLVEAPTGTGKSLAYLCAAAVTAMGERPLRVVVATGTKALQDQLIGQDAPRSRAMREAGLPPPIVEVVKGRRNYLCKKRLADWQPPLGLDSFTARHVQKIRGWADRTVVGDRSELADVPEDSPLWNELDADGDVCLGTTCPMHTECHITTLRARAREAHIIITNHHLLCTDLKLRFLGGSTDARVLPPYDALVLDEAHKLPSVAAEYFGMSVTPSRVDALVRDAARVALMGNAANSLRTATEALQRESHALFTSVGGTLMSTAEAARVTFRIPEAPDVEDAAIKALQALEGLRAQVDAHSAVRPEQQPECDALSRRLETLHMELAHVTEARDDRFAYCAERRGVRGRLMAYPADVAAVLQNTLLSGTEPIIFTSATLAVAGDFNSFRSDVGLAEESDNTQCVALPTTFSADQAVLYVPKDLPDPDAPHFTEKACDRARELIELTGGGAFMLCTTNRAMNEMAKRLTSSLPSMLVLRQGDAPKADLVSRFKRDGHAVLVATHSFWEGVDVRGHALRLVMVDKLPFAPPSDPLVAARLQRAERMGQHPFHDVQLADAVLALRQGLGRLLRSRQDRGVMAVMDGRLWRRAYGKRVMAALGDHPHVWNWDDLAGHVERLGVTS